MIGFYNYTVILTYIGTASGIYGIIAALTRSPRLGIICLMLSGLCDMFDGTIARTRQRTDDEKRFGIQVDSLSDLICFGVLPACIGYGIGLNKPAHMIILISYPLAALIRLAYFNVVEETRQSTTSGKREAYEGLPVTNAALLFPFVMLLTTYTGLRYLKLAYGATMVCTAMAFIINFRVKKLNMKGMILVALFGLAELLLLVYGNGFEF